MLHRSLSLLCNRLFLFDGLSVHVCVCMCIFYSSNVVVLSFLLLNGCQCECDSESECPPSVLSIMQAPEIAIPLLNKKYVEMMSSLIGQNPLRSLILSFFHLLIQHTHTQCAVRLLCYLPRSSCTIASLVRAHHISFCCMCVRVYVCVRE